jgi:hypothetical protein
MSIDEMDFCSDQTIVIAAEDGSPSVYGMSRARTAWLRRGIKGGDFKGFKLGSDGYPVDNVLKQLSEEEKNELNKEIQEYQKLGE